MGATVLNGARIGSNCLVGANALVTENKEFSDNCLIVGAPARVVRSLNEEEIVRMRQSAEGYVRNWKRFKKEMKFL
jgi:carbonic anhydrase/acetyltransferase-like protein (isoleucine patch superfamily)